MAKPNPPLCSKPLAISFAFIFFALLGSLVFAFVFLATVNPFSPNYDYVFSSTTPSSPSSISASIAIFAAPARPFLSFDSADPLYNAVSSWIHLMPSAQIFLLGNDPSFFNASLELPGKVFVEPHIDHNFKGTPHFHSMLARAQQSDAGITLLVMDTSVVFLQGFLDALCKTMQMHQDWVMFGRDSEQLEGGVEYWAWNNNQNRDPLMATTVPPFSHVAGTYEDWLLYHLMQESRPHRDVIDATEAQITGKVIEPTTERTNPSTWESDVNARLLSEVGNMSIKIPWRLMHCAEAKVHNLCMIEEEQEKKLKIRRRRAPDACGRSDVGDQRENIEQHRVNDGGAADPWKEKKMSHTLDELLPQVADENRVVMMVGGTSNYKEMLLSFVCRVQTLGIKSVLVAAFDEELMEFAYMRGLAVYMERSSEDYKPVIGADGHCIFASECFKQVSKLKSMSVLRVLRKGYSVFWSDIDIYWFRNPLPELMAYGAGTLVIQSDEPDENRPENSIRGANSGFYLARAEEITIRAFRAIVGHAMGTDLTEQPSFYDILCGERGEKRVGDRECRHGELRTIFLSRDEFPNGQVFQHWMSGNATMSCRQKGCAVLHNNYIQGRQEKMKRLVMNGMWFYDVEQEMCLQPWHPLHPASHDQNLTSFQDHFLSALHL